MNCKQCSAELNPGAKFCPKCGAALVGENESPPCVSCGKPLKPGAKFCPHCGASQLQNTAPVHAPPVSDAPVGKTAVPRQTPVATPSIAVGPVLAEAAVDQRKNQGRTQTAPVEPEQASKAPGLDMQPPLHDAKNRKTWPLWLAGGLAIVALGAGSAWYFHLIPGMTPKSTAVQDAAITSQPTAPVADMSIEAGSAPAEEPVQAEGSAPMTESAPPEPSVAKQTSPEKSVRAHATPPPTRQGQTAASPTPAWATPQGSSPASSSSAQAAQTESKSGVAAGEQTQDAVAVARPPQDPFAKCRGLSNFIERKWCEEKTRFKICQGRWGTAPECPKAEDNSEYQY